MTPFIASHAAALALVLVEAVLRAWRLQLLLPREGRPGLWRAFTVNAYGDAMSVVTPARLGGDPARFLGLRRSGTEAPAALVALGAEQAIDWLVLLGAAVVLAAAFGDEGMRGLAALGRRLTTTDFRPWLAAAVALVLASGLAAHWYRRRHPGLLRQSLNRALASVKQLPAQSVATATALTTLCTALRVAVLPVLLIPFGVRGNLGALILGSFGLVHGQLFLPTPAGVGGIELGFAAGFAGSLSGSELAGLLLAWRAYTTFFDALLGAGLFGWALWTRRRLGTPTADR